MRTPVLVSSLMVGISLFDVTCAIAPLRAEQPPVRSVKDVPAPPTSSGTVEDLGQLDNNDSQDWFWGVSPAKAGNQQSGDYQIDSNSAPPTADPNQELQEWNNSNRGDPLKRSPGIPLTNF